MKMDKQFQATSSSLWKAFIILAVFTSFVMEFSAEASSDSSKGANNQFPKDFLFGVATSAYQIEGAWNVDGKGENIWDHLLHNEPNFTQDGRNADVAVNSYYQYQDDMNALSSVGANLYRISISWSRILPTGYANVINKAGIDYYNKVIDSMLQRNVTPAVTLYHFDLPNSLQKLGGWPNPVIIDEFVDYAEIIFENFGDRVKWWITFNEPNMFSAGYSELGVQAPNIDAPGIGDYLVSATVLKAHARVWHLYDRKYRKTQQGKVGMVINCEWQQPATDSTEDAAAADRALQFNIGLWAHPVYTEEGDYAEVVRERVAANSRLEGRKRSRLPHFTADEVEFIRGTADFFGLTHYSTTKAADGITGNIPSKEYDAGVNVSVLAGYPLADGGSDLQLVPWGIRKILNWLAKSYPGYPIMIFENGWRDSGTLQDYQRIAYHGCYLSEVLRAIHEDQVNVTAYTIWSLLDNFEFAYGYTRKFGLFRVDIDDPQRKRIPKASVSFIKQVYDTGTVPLEYFNADVYDLKSICYTTSNGKPYQDQQTQRKRSCRPQLQGKQKQQKQQKLRKKVEPVIHGNEIKDTTPF